MIPNMQPIVLVLPLLVLVGADPSVHLAPRHLDQFATGWMMEDGNMRGAAPECGGLGWVYHNGHCYLFDRYCFDHLRFRCLTTVAFL